MSVALQDESSRLHTLVGELLEEQANLTAVERFALRESRGDVHHLRSSYEELIPSGRPGSGEQYAFRVDLDACTGCKACVTACHSLNGLDEGETWRRVGSLIGEAAELPAQHTVTGACHHCEDPGCLSGCPVRAYEKDEVTGIVRHLDDQCIGCKYCTLTCPYDVPQYNPRLGIVRKCDMCTGRLEVGEAPACVQGCPNGAIQIAIVPTGQPRAGSALLPTSPDDLVADSITRPSTCYAGGPAEGTTLRPADADALVTSPAHWPLAVLLVCTQLSVGLVSVEVAARAFGVEGPVHAWWAGLALVSAVAGQVAAFLHLGRPLYAFRAILGLRTSWMSREIATLGLYVSALVLYCGVILLGAPLAPALLAGLSAFVLAVGWMGVGTSIMIYAVTGRALWSPRRTAFRFVGTALASGAAAGAALGAIAGLNSELVFLLAALAALACGLRLVAESAVRAHDLTSANAALVRSARLEREVLRDRASRRRKVALLGIAGVFAAACAQAFGAPLASVAVLSLGAVAASVSGELAERNLFFVSESTRGMPGV